MTETARRETLDERYGRSRGLRRRDKIVAWCFGIVVGVVVVAWAVWASADQTGPSLESLDVAHTIVDEHAVEVTFDVSVEPGTPVTCAVQALNESFGIVGWAIVDFGPESLFTTRHTTHVLTTERATTGLVYRCWIT